MRILKPTIGKHDGSSFRELLDMWKENGYCEVIDNTDLQPSDLEETLRVESRPWVNEVGSILLYDNPIADKLHDSLTWDMALFANEVPFLKNCYAWTFWPKHPKAHEEVTREAPLPQYNDRPVKSCFFGTFTTNMRGLSDWSTVIEKFWMGQCDSRLLNPKEYLNVLKNSKFGLCLAGVGPKCLRDMELIGMGTVPVFTNGVSTEYYNRLEKDRHFLYGESPEEVAHVIAECSQDKWEYMSKECLRWYEENASPKGSYELTRRIIEENGGSIH